MSLWPPSFAIANAVLPSLARNVTSAPPREQHIDDPHVPVRRGRHQRRLPVFVLRVDVRARRIIACTSSSPFTAAANITGVRAFYQNQGSASPATLAQSSNRITHHLMTPSDRGRTLKERIGHRLETQVTRSSWLLHSRDVGSARFACMPHRCASGSVGQPSADELTGRQHPGTLGPAARARLWI